MIYPKSVSLIKTPLHFSTSSIGFILNAPLGYHNNSLSPATLTEIQFAQVNSGNSRILPKTRKMLIKLRMKNAEL